MPQPYNRSLKPLSPETLNPKPGCANVVLRVSNVGHASIVGTSHPSKPVNTAGVLRLGFGGLGI